MFSPQHPDWPTLLSVHWVPSPGVKKRPEREADHLSSAEVENARDCTCAFLYAFVAYRGKIIPETRTFRRSFLFLS